MEKPDQRFPKSRRLLSQQQFDRVHNESAFAADDTLVVKAARSESGETRLGLAVGRKVGNAVERNRWKRRIREAFRRHYHELPTGLDLVIRPRKGATCDYDSICRSLAKLVVRVSKKVRKSN